ncbi:hypothetical protein PRIPAC_79912 [Pristionchus pacificus]|uniref:Uncharacterized protein n=1 Tax=Pristionchus pacificus TaxID=54126 RepID=A0A454XWT7_PRIPA|nr:hypothetical protein PRIPAC_79912 [Pristionchus pacificus]|eukprot:PDM78851.1 hypothetical protein PRIPAC_31430 [Pristionchus pacificus]
MRGRLEDENYDYFANDTRRETKIWKDANSHHIWYEVVGPGVIIRSQLSGTRNHDKSEDLFGMSCDDAPHSIDKGRRWERVDNVEKILPRQKIDDKLSIVFASLPGSRMEWGVFRDTRDLEQASLYHKRGGIRKCIEVDNEAVTVRLAKTNRSFFCGSQSASACDASPKKDNVSSHARQEETALSHTRYSIVQLQRRDSKMVDRSWRGWQQQYGYEFKYRRRPSMRRFDWRLCLNEALDTKLHDIDECSEDFEKSLRKPYNSDEPVHYMHQTR